MAPILAAQSAGAVVVGALAAGCTCAATVSMAFQTCGVLVAEGEQRHAAEAGVDGVLHPDLGAVGVDVVHLARLRARRRAVVDRQLVRERHLVVRGVELRRGAAPVARSAMSRSDRLMLPSAVAGHCPVVPTTQL